VSAVNVGPCVAGITNAMAATSYKVYDGLSQLTKYGNDGSQVIKVRRSRISRRLGSAARWRETLKLTTGINRAMREDQTGACSTSQTRDAPID